MSYAPHARNVEALAELLFRVEHHELGVAPAFERLPQARQDLFRRRARFLSTRGVVVPAAVAADVHRALGLEDDEAGAERIRETLERVARGDVPDQP
jgi:hypothetical protein